jgi:outer membrane protein assembly factor BamE
MFRSKSLPLVAIWLAGCSSWVNHQDRFAYVVPLYKVEIVQGNVVTKEQAERIKPGMSREQVRDILGSPMLADAFHADRWDYVFTIRRQGAEPQARQVVARFNGEALKALEIPTDLPTEEAFVASINTFKPTGAAPKLQLTEEERNKLARPAAAAPAAPSEAQGPARVYPPLEKP